MFFFIHQNEKNINQTMLSKIILTTLAATVVSSETVAKYLVVKSDNTEINDNTLGFPHEGAGINYAFLGTSAESQPLDYDADTKSLSSNLGSLVQRFSVEEGPVELTVVGSNDQITFNDDNVLLVNGTSDNFYACKNIGDPYNYSASSYALMYLKSDIPDGCIGLTLEAEEEEPSSSSVSSSETTTSFTSSIPSDGYLTTVTEESTTYTTYCNTTSSSISSYKDGAVKFAPAGAFAALFGAAAILL